MPDRYWVGGTASWDGTAGTKWSATSGGPGGASVPTTADDVFFTNLSTGTCTIATGNTGARSINCTGFAGTITGTPAITVAGSVTLVAAMTYTHTGTMTFSGTGTLTTAGKAFSGVTVNGAGITLTLGDALNVGGRIVVVTNGTFTTGNFSVTGGALSSTNSNTRTINLGLSTLNLANNVGVDFTIPTNLTFNAGSSQINLSSPSGSILATGQTFRNVSFTSTDPGIRSIQGANIFTNITLTPVSLAGVATLALAGNQTVNGTFTCAGATALRRCFVNSSFLATARTITAAAISAANCDFRDITLAGAAAGSSPTRAGDCGGNSGITFPAAKTVWRVGTNTSWSGVNSWATSSGGTGADNNFPLAQDTAVIDQNTALTGTLSVSSFNMSAIDASTRTTGITLSFPAFTSFYGSIALGSGVTVTGTGLARFFGRGTMDFTSAGKTITFPVIVDAPGGTLRLLDAVSLTNTFSLERGTLNLNGNTLTATTFNSSNSNPRTLAFGAGNITVTSTGTVWNTATVTEMTVAGTPVVNVTNTTASAATVTPGSPTEANSISFNFTAGTYLLSAAGNYRSLNFTGFSGTLNGEARTIFGNLTLSTGMTIAGTTASTTFGSTSGTPQTIRTNGRTLDFFININGVGGTLRLLDALTMGSTRQLTHNGGTIDFNGFNLTVGSTYVVSGTNTKNLTFNGGTLTCPGTGLAFNITDPTGFTTTAGTGTGTINMTSASAKTFAGNGRTFNCTLNNGGAGALTITGSNTFTTLANSVQPTSFLFTTGSTQTISNWEIDGAPGNLVTIGSTTAGTHTLFKASGTVSADYLSISNSAATGAAAWYAGANSTNGGGNSGWIFTAPPGPGPSAASNFFLLLGDW